MHFQIIYQIIKVNLTIGLNNKVLNSNDFKMFNYSYLKIYKIYRTRLF